MSLIAETRALERLNGLLADATCLHKDGARIRCGHFTVQGITQVKKAPSTAKADFILCSQEGPELYISHKDANFSWNGYGSVGRKAFLHRSPYRDHVIWNYAKWAADYCLQNQATRFAEDGFFEWCGEERGVWSTPPSRVQNLIVYGSSFGANYGLHNCHVAAVGRPNLALVGGIFELTFEGGLTSNGDVPAELDSPIIAIGGRIGSQKHRYLLTESTGFFGWLGVFPLRLIRGGIASPNRQRRGKGDGLVQIEWPKEIEA